MLIFFLFFLVTKVYAAFNGLHNLKILLFEWKMSFKIGSLRCVKYIEKQPTQYQPLPFSVGDNVQSEIL